jgi:hypothetical protein
MNSGEAYVFTLRNHIRSAPRVTQVKIYLTQYDYKIMSYADALLSAEKEKGKKADKSKMDVYKSFLAGRNKQDFFTDGGVYIRFLDKWVETKEGWCNLKKL